MGAEVTASYLRGVNLIAMVDPQGEFEWYYHFNYHGDVTELTDATGTVVKTYTYDAFGNEENIDHDDINPFRYTSEYFDKETGKIYLRARYYNPQIGRFINQDSYLGNQVDPLSLNLYTYTHNNPVMGVDPSGHIFETLLDVGSLIDSTITIFKEPSLINAGMLAWDVASVFIPGAPGSYVAKGAKLLSKADDVVDLGKSAKTAVKMVGNVDKIVDTTKSSKTFAQFNLQIFAGKIDDNAKLYDDYVDLLKRVDKPKGSPVIEKWYNNGGKIQVDKNGIWGYLDWDGNMVTYPNGYPDFKSAGLVRDTAPIGKFTGNRGKDRSLAMDKLKYPDYSNVRLHHAVEDGIIQVIEKNIHTRFTHYGGHQLYK